METSSPGMEGKDGELQLSEYQNLQKTLRCAYYPKLIFDLYDIFWNAQVDVRGPAVQVLPPSLRESLHHLVEPKVTIVTIVNITVIVFFFFKSS